MKVYFRWWYGVSIVSCDTKSQSWISIGAISTKSFLPRLHFKSERRLRRWKLWQFNAITVHILCLWSFTTLTVELAACLCFNCWRRLRSRFLWWITIRRRMIAYLGRCQSFVERDGELGRCQSLFNFFVEKKVHLIYSREIIIFVSKPEIVWANSKSIFLFETLDQKKSSHSRLKTQDWKKNSRIESQNRHLPREKRPTISNWEKTICDTNECVKLPVCMKTSLG